MEAARPTLPERPCPVCGKPVEPLRAGQVVLLEDGFRFLCDADCRTRFAQGERDHDASRATPRTPAPALLHGDLWAGNALAVVDPEGPRIAVIDPACSIGDGWWDVGMMQLFGGFPDACLRAYADAVDDHDRVESRTAVARLYHLLNHVNLFGRGYAAQALAVAGALVR